VNKANKRDKVDKGDEREEEVKVRRHQNMLG
jgi:hypothetical protein